jgi:hypothetical protein
MLNVAGVIGHIGSAMFSFEGNGAVLTIYSEAKNKHRY